ncbi:hypothetical protein TNIN_78771 [Trichonephila inaurata madagascariensis]|uniref:Uncharacterized protein n=1 Tax=Trichonephila inaurata madagascariensis TaxID=2747483 RepID=A0A8X6YMV5_9ARAC|nr:hypothetical protein TNIN_78771 [Trichonephila inaurata madagascariensis]
MNEIKEGKESEESDTSHIFWNNACSAKPAHIFCAEFDKILESGDDISLDPEIEYAQFLLSRCKLLCLEPTYSSFLLVSAFLTRANFAGNIECFRTLYITEFCFLVLYRRVFWKIFNSFEGFQNLHKFCDEFHKNFTVDSTLSDLRNTSIGAHWRHTVLHSVDATDESFNSSLEDEEVKSFEEEYSARNHMDCVSEASREIESFLFPCKSEIKSLCKTCGSKCHNYLAYTSQLSF